MRKIGVFVFITLLLVGFVFAANETNQTNSSVSTDDEVGMQQDSDKIEAGFDCLEKEVKNDCSGAESIQEIALTILASPKQEVLESCVNKLKSNKEGDCFGDGGCNVLDTALGVLALEHIGEDTEKSENWLLNKAKLPNDLIWYLQQDSNEKTTCQISYSGEDYNIEVNENKKISSNAGDCLSRAQGNFWLQINQNCLDKKYLISCDRDFISTLLYKNKNAPTIYVLEDTKSEPAFGTIELEVKSKCFSDSSECDYEASAWATLALLKTGNDVEEYIPYIIALADSNERYLPNAFVYMVTNYDDYGNQLVEEQELGNYWIADSSAYNKFYDTALALLSLQGNSGEKITKAKDWALFSQSSDGCWSSSIRDTAIMLWALEGRSPSYSGGSSGGVTYCSEANYYCIPESDCPGEQKLENYFCSGLSSVCCESENLKSCSEYNGQVCDSGLICSGNEKRALDSDYCCLGDCVEPTIESECEELGYICKSSCSENQESIDYSCDTGVCCKTKPVEESSYWWIWLLVIGIIIILVVIAWIYREKLKLLWFKIKSKFKKDKGKGSPQQGGGMPPRPGFPPVRRRMPMKRSIPPRRPQQSPQTNNNTDKALDDTFKKLKEMSK